MVVSKHQFELLRTGQLQELRYKNQSSGLVLQRKFPQTITGCICIVCRSSWNSHNQFTVYFAGLDPALKKELIYIPKQEFIELTLFSVPMVTILQKVCISAKRKCEKSSTAEKVLIVGYKSQHPPTSNRSCKKIQKGFCLLFQHTLRK